MTRSDSTEFIALIPAGGTGTRVGSDKPKQYLPILGQAMIVRTINALLACDWVSHVYVVVAEQDPYQDSLLGLTGSRCSVLPVGGSSRRDSVLAGLQAILSGRDSALHLDGGQTDKALMPWILVHDAARPGLSVRLLEQLRDCVLSQLASNTDPQAALGALLALPVADTIKREQIDDTVGVARVAHTVDRTGLWAAQTPQVFPLDLLHGALSVYEQATDEASAIEQLGYSPALVPGHWHNMKVTTADDLALIRQVFEARQHNSLMTGSQALHEK